MLQNTIYYAGKQTSGEELFLLEIVNIGNDFSNYIYTYVKAIYKDDKYKTVNVEFINNIFNSLYSLNMKNLEKIDGDLYNNILYSTVEFLLDYKKDLKINNEVYNFLIDNLELNGKADDKTNPFVKKDIYTANKIKALDFISEMENRKC